MHNNNDISTYIESMGPGPGQGQARAGPGPTMLSMLRYHWYYAYVDHFMFFACIAWPFFFLHLDMADHFIFY